MTNIEDLIGWTPYKIYWEQSQGFVDWCNLGQTRLTRPFFMESVQPRLRDSATIHLHTPIETLTDLQAIQPGLAPSGFIFHISRCGSTLVSQMLAVLSQNIVVSEAPPIDSIIRAEQQVHSISDWQRLRWLQDLIGVLGQPRQPQEKHLFIKLDCWHLLDFALIQRAFPETPKVFLYRNPVEVMVSLMREPSLAMLPGTIPPEQLGLMPANVAAMSREEYCAVVLAALMRSALEHQTNLHFVNYNQLPEIVWSSLLDIFHVDYSAQDLEKMSAVTAFDAKTPELSFTSDTDEKNRHVTEAIHNAADRWINPLYEQAEEIGWIQKV